MTARGQRKGVNPWKRKGNAPHSLHKMLSRPGSMPPAMARHFIREYTSAGDLVLDPFCGKGTVLLEAAILRRRAIGSDVAPDAVLVANAKVDPPSKTAIKAFLDTLPTRSAEQRGAPWQIRTFFSPKTLRQLLGTRDYLLKAAASGNHGHRKSANFILGTLLGILHGHSKLSLSLPCSHSFAMAPNYVRKYAREAQLRRPYRDVKKCLGARVDQLLQDGPPKTRGRAHLLCAERAHTLKGLKRANSADLILTSPPYLNVQTYAKDSWLRFWLLKQEYRRLRESFIETGSPQMYIQKMKPCLSAMLRVLKPLHYAVIVAGDAPYSRKGKKRYFRTATKLGKLAQSLMEHGYTFRVVAIVPDSIPSSSRYYSAVHKDGKKTNSDNGRKGVRVERILVLRKVKCRSKGPEA
jgi:SAM-dependent methyltransferase